MIEIKFYKNKNRYAISAMGHAEYAQHGQDIVCAAVSTLLQSLGNYIESGKVEGAQLLDNRQEPGDINVEFCNKCFCQLVDPTLRALYEMTKDALENIAEQYPDNIKIKP